MLVLAHPHSTDDYLYDEEWPGAGLGRELPVLAALGGLDGLEVVSYSNDPDEDWVDWYDVLSAGLPCPALTGTDAVLCQTCSAPAGGWRTYADLGALTILDYDTWVDAIRTGRTFVTNYPLIPRFEVAGARPGETLAVEGDRLEASVHLQALCAIGLRRLALVAEGEEIWTSDLTGCPAPLEIDTTFTIETPTPAWIAAKIEGRIGHPHASVGLPMAHTNAIRITQNGSAIRRTRSSARWLDELEMLDEFVELRGAWQEPWQRDAVLARITRSGAFYAEAFVRSPEEFHLLHPDDGDTLHEDTAILDWEDARDAETGDRVDYVLWVFADSTLNLPCFFYRSSESDFDGLSLPVQQWYWWTVEAIDRGGNTTRSTPPVACFYMQLPVADAGEKFMTETIVPRAFPNPSFGPVALLGCAEPTSIVDLTGWRVAGVGDGVESVRGVLIWNGTIGGQQAPPGFYWARSGSERPSSCLIRTR